MSSVTRKGDNCTGHGSYGAVPLISGSDNVLINDKPCGRVGDQYSPHGSHSDIISKGSDTVFVNGIPIARVGDSVSPDGTVANGSPNVTAG